MGMVAVGQPLPHVSSATNQLLVDIQWATQSPAQNTSGLNVKLYFSR